MLSTGVTKLMFVTEAEYKYKKYDQYRQHVCPGQIYVMQNWFSIPLQVRVIVQSTGKEFMQEMK